MKKEEFIKKYGEEKYAKQQEQSRDWNRCHPAEVLANGRKWRRKDGKYYKKKRQHQMSGISYAKHLIRSKHRKKWTPYKQIIAPESQIHHEWGIPGTGDYTGVALVENKDENLTPFGIGLKGKLLALAAEVK